MRVEFRTSRAGLLWAGLFLSALLAVVLLATGPQASKALAPLEGVSVHKEVNVPSIPPGGLPAPIYTVIFSNSNVSDVVVLDTITDTLPTGFMFSTMAAGSDVDDPPSGAPYGPLVWTRTYTVAAGEELTLRYAIYVPDDVPPEVEPRYNEVVARAEDGSIVGPASAPLVVGDVSLALQKEVAPALVGYGEAVTYTVTISNNGEMTGTVEVITDTPDAGLTFDGMVEGSDIITGPVVSGTLVWTGSWDVAPRSALVLKYRAMAPAGDEYGRTLCNEVAIATQGDTVVPAPAEACVQVGTHVYLPITFMNYEYPRFVVEKTAFPSALDTTPGQTVDYTVDILAEGDGSGTLSSVHDLLPPGFSFVDMVAGSDVLDDPTVVGQALTWEGPWQLSPGDRLRLIYEVSAPTTTGIYANQAEVMARGANVPQEPAEAIVSVDEPIAGLTASNDGPTNEGKATTLSASVTAGTNISYTWDFGDGASGTGEVTTHVYPAVGVYTATVTAKNGISQEAATTVVSIEPAVLLEEDFENGWDLWTEFLNYKYRLAPGQWYWDSNDGFNNSAAVTQDCFAVDDKEAEDALLMYLQPGAEDWTDYRIEAKMIIRCDDHPHGLWVRGQYEDVGDEDPAGWVTGYYIMIGGSPSRDTHFVSLKQMQTAEDCWGEACNNPQNLYDFNNPHELTYTKKDGTLARWTWHTIVVEVRGYNVQVWLNGVQYINYDDTKEPFLTGTIGLKTFKANTVSFDDIIVTPLD